MTIKEYPPMTFEEASKHKLPTVKEMKRICLDIEGLSGNYWTCEQGITSEFRVGVDSNGNAFSVPLDWKLKVLEI